MTILDPFVRPAVGMIDMIASIFGGGNGTFNPGQGMSPPGGGAVGGQGTSTAAPTFVASQQIVAAATHTSVGVPTLPLTAQQRGIPTGLGYGTSLPPGGGGRGRAPTGGTGDATTQEQSGGGATSTSAGGGRGARRAV